MIILTISFMPKISRVFIFLVVMALGLEVISLADAHHRDWGKHFIQILRDKDRALIGSQYPAGTAEVEVSFPDVAFAPYPVNVRQSDSIYVIPNE
jgi:hypothetical protein